MPELKNEKWERWAQEYIIDFNIVRATHRAGYGEGEDENYGNLYAIGYNLKQKPEVRERIKELIRLRRREYEWTEDRAITEIARIAFADVTKVVEAFDGRVVTFKQLSEIPEAIRPAIKKLEQTQWGVKVEMYDKLTALDMMAKWLGIYEKDNDQKRPLGPQIYLPTNGRDTINGEQPKQLPKEGGASDTLYLGGPKGEA